MQVRTLTWAPGTGWSPDLSSFGEADGASTLVLAFADPSIADTPHPLHQLSATFGRSHLLACSTAGQILDDSVSEAEIVVAVAQFERTGLALAWETVSDHAGSRSVGSALGAAMSGKDHLEALSAVFVVSDGLVVNGSDLVNGLVQSLTPGVHISGGLAADGPDFGRTWVFVEGEVREGVVAAIGLHGDCVAFGHGSVGGWDSFGPERRVTRSDANVLHELDGRPALALYKDYLGERAAELPSSALLFPLSIRSPGGDVSLVRTVLAVDDEQQTMTFAGDVPEGWTARLMRTTVDRLVDGAHAAGVMSMIEVPQTDSQLALAVSCVGRRLVMGTRTDEEVEATLEALGPDTTLVGFYSYGEIAPSDGFCSLHNQTMTVTTIRER